MRDDEPSIDWGKTTFDGRRCEQLRRVPSMTVRPREACPRLCLARKFEIQALRTFDFWASDFARCEWTSFLATLELAQWIDDPARGPLLT